MGKGFTPPSQITKGFLADTITGDNLKFQFNPNEITMTRTPVWATIGVPGLSHPKMQFISGGEKQFTFTLEFFTNERGRQDVKRKMDWLESLTYPDFGGTNNLKRGAHPVLFVFGQLYKSKCVVTGLSTSAVDLFDPQSLLPLRAKVDVTLTELIIERSKSYTDIRG